MGKQIRGMTMLASASFIWGTAFVAQRVGMEYIGPATFIAVRFFVGGVSLLPVIFVNSLFNRKKTGQGGGIRVGKDARPLLIGGFYCGVTIFISGLLQQVGIIYTTVGKSGFITTLYIVMVPILGLFWGRKVSRRMWCCVFIAITGMYLLCVNESVSLNKGDAYTFICAMVSAVHILLVDHYSPLADGVKLSCIQFFVCCGLGFIAAFTFEQPQLPAIYSAWAPILYTGVLSSGLAFTIQVIAQRDVNPVAASLIMSLESVFAVLMGWLLIGETLSAKELSGCVLIFAANLLIQIPGSVIIIKKQPPGAAGG
jgi:drug/metabolite transporter (DMT)-like permease